VARIRSSSITGGSDGRLSSGRRAYSRATAEREAGVTPIGWLHSTTGRYFRCQARFARDYVDRGTGWRNNWWAYAKTDDGHWGWAPEVYFRGGGNDHPDAGLVTR
jgi:hypothetical protein